MKSFLAQRPDPGLLKLRRKRFDPESTPKDFSCLSDTRPQNPGSSVDSKNPRLLAKSRASSRISEKSSPKLARKQHSHEVSSPSTSLRVRKRRSSGFTSPGSAAPSGFLNLLTLSSARPLSALFHADSVHGVVAPRGFLSFSSRHDFRRALPLQLESAIAQTTSVTDSTSTTEVISDHQPLAPPSPVASRFDPRTEPSLRDSCTWKIRSRCERCYPTPTGRASLSLFTPLRSFTSEPRPRASTRSPLLGFIVAPKQVCHNDCSAEFQRTQG